MINLSSYPIVQLNNTNGITGTFNKKALLNKSFLTNNTNTLFISKKQNSLASFANNIKKKENGFLIEIIFHGFNYSSRRFRLSRNKFSIDTHKSELFICEEDIAETFKSRVHKRRLIYFSYNIHLVDSIKNTIKQLKLPDSYTGKGLFERNDTYVIKQRKKRK